MRLLRRIKRSCLFLFQRITRGFSDSDLWSLDYTIAKFVLPRLKTFRETSQGSPGNLDENDWLDIIDKMIYAFEYALENGEGVTEKDDKKYQEGMRLFADWFLALWS